jgi:hypothetical protein
MFFNILKIADQALQLCFSLKRAESDFKYRNCQLNI